MTTEMTTNYDTTIYAVYRLLMDRMIWWKDLIYIWFLKFQKKNK